MFSSTKCVRSSQCEKILVEQWRFFVNFMLQQGHTDGPVVTKTSLLSTTICGQCDLEGQQQMQCDLTNSKPCYLESSPKCYLDQPQSTRNLQNKPCLFNTNHSRTQPAICALKLDGSKQANSFSQVLQVDVHCHPHFVDDLACDLWAL